MFGDFGYLLHSFLLQSAFLSHAPVFMFEQFLHLQPLFSGFDIFVSFLLFGLLSDLSGRINNTLGDVGGQYVSFPKKRRNGHIVRSVWCYRSAVKSIGR